MPATESLQPLTGTQLAADPNVIVPAHVQAAAAAAEELHKRAYTVESEPAAPAAPQPEPQPQPAPEQQAPLDQQQPSPPAQDFTGVPTKEELQGSDWAARYNSMRGRYEALQRTVGSMEEQMRQMGVELVRTQELLAQNTPAPASQTRHAAPASNANLITEEDRQNYGDELIDLARRAALSSVTPELELLRAENQRLTQRVSNTSKRELFVTLDRALPNWRAINTSVQFKNWLHLPNVYTGQIRGNMLKAAVDGAEAPKVIALFKDFLAEAQATGMTAPTAQSEQQQDPGPAPRNPALDLETLAAPGRARPAPGDSQVPSEKPIYSRADISKFYDEKRRGLWANRVAEAQAIENDLTAAQREGRIR